MTIGFPGRTNRYLCSWGVQQRIEDSNKPRIEVRGIKQDLWKKAMLASDAVRIKYASKYAGSSNYWKNSIGMNRGLTRLNVIDRKKTEEAAFTAWVKCPSWMGSEPFVKYTRSCRERKSFWSVPMQLYP